MIKKPNLKLLLLMIVLIATITISKDIINDIIEDNNKYFEISFEEVYKTILYREKYSEQSMIYSNCVFNNKTNEFIINSRNSIFFFNPYKKPVDIRVSKFDGYVYDFYISDNYITAAIGNDIVLRCIKSEDNLFITDKSGKYFQDDLQLNDLLLLNGENYIIEKYENNIKIYDFTKKIKPKTINLSKDMNIKTKTFIKTYVDDEFLIISEEYIYVFNCISNSITKKVELLYEIENIDNVGWANRDNEAYIIYFNQNNCIIYDLLSFEISTKIENCLLDENNLMKIYQDICGRYVIITTVRDLRIIDIQTGSIKQIKSSSGKISPGILQPNITRFSDDLSYLTDYKGIKDSSIRNYYLTLNRVTNIKP